MRGFLDAWGAFLGFAGGFVLIGLAALLLDPDPGIVVLFVPVGFVSGTFGAAYGAVAKAAVAACVAPLVRWRRVRLAARVVGATVGALVVVGISAVVFHPDLEPGANETEEHVRSDVLLMYLVPGGMAATAGAAFTPGLLLGRRERPAGDRATG